MPESVRIFFEPRFGQDFSQVRVHTDAKAAEAARAVNARAFTVGSNVVFGEKEYAPEISEGRRLLAHELTHVVQQGGCGQILEGKEETEISRPTDQSRAYLDQNSSDIVPSSPGTPLLQSRPIFKASTNNLCIVVPTTVQRQPRGTVAGINDKDALGLAHLEDLFELYTTNQDKHTVARTGKSYTRKWVYGAGKHFIENEIRKKLIIKQHDLEHKPPGKLDELREWYLKKIQQIPLPEDNVRKIWLLDIVHTYLPYLSFPPVETMSGHESRPLPTERKAALTAMDVRLREVIRVNEARAVAAQQYLVRGLQVADEMRIRLACTTQNYALAYDRYRRVLASGDQGARDREELATILIGIGVGVGVGMISNAIVVEEGIATGTKLIVELLGESAEAGVMQGMYNPVAAPHIEPSGMDPLSFAAPQYEKIIDMYRGLVLVGEQGMRLPLLLSRAQYLDGQVRLLLASVKANHTFEALRSMFNQIDRVERLGLAKVQYPTQALEDVAAELKAAPIVSARDFEQYLWIEWIANLVIIDEAEETYYYTQHDVLDIDEIEDYLHGEIGILGTHGLLGVDTRATFDTDMEIEALRRADKLWGDLYHDKYRPMLD